MMAVIKTFDLTDTHIALKSTETISRPAKRFPTEEDGHGPGRH
jgi:hypothetical protein